MAPDDLASEEALRSSFLAHAVAAELYTQAAHSEGVIADALLGRQIGRCEILDRTPAHCTFRAELADGAGPIRTLDRAGAITGLATVGDAGPPIFTELRSDALPPTGGSRKEARIRALVHLFFSLVENPVRAPQPFYPLLAERFSLALVDPAIETLAAVDSWVRERLASVTASEHVLDDIAICDCAPGPSRVRIAMKSQALFPDGSGAISRNTQIWTLVDNPSARLPQIEHVAIERDGVIFFGPPPEYAIRQSPIG